MPRKFVSFSKFGAPSAKRVYRAHPPKAYTPTPLEVRLANRAKPKPKKFTQGGKVWLNQEKEPIINRIYNMFEQNMEQDKPHFRIGGKEVYFPKGNIILLRPNPKHTPFQAKFIVPRTFNKLDLRDYLYHLYGLRALNVTTQLMWGRWTRQTPVSPRYRLPQIKKMTIEMADPFVWPEPIPKEEYRSDYNIELEEQLNKYREEVRRLGSDKLRPPTTFGGIVGPYVPPTGPFIPRRLSRQMMNKTQLAGQLHKREDELEVIKRYLQNSKPFPADSYSIKSEAGSSSSTNV
jgi:large subunit ribosomal protein L23